MRAIKHGYLWTEVKVTCTNDKCHCVFLYYPKDVLTQVDYDFETKEGRAYKYTRCPECGQRYIFTDPITKKTYNDRLVQTDEPTTIIFDGGEEEDTPVYDEDGNQIL